MLPGIPDLDPPDRLSEVLTTLRHVAHHDGLTGLAGRALFVRDLTSACTGPCPKPGVLVIDLDAFQSVNDEYGHTMGDEVLRVVGRRIRNLAPSGARVARLGNDAFAILLPRVRCETEAVRLASRVREAIGRDIHLFGARLQMTCSVGVSVGQGPASDAGDLLHQADRAMRAAKQRRPGQMQLHGALTPLRAGNEGPAATSSLQVAVRYEPLTNVDGGTFGVEALVTWRDANGTTYDRDLIGSISQDSRVSLGQRVLDQVLSDVGTLREEGASPKRICLEVCAAQLQDPDFAARTVTRLNRARIDPGTFVLLLTEPALLSDHPVVPRNVELLHEHGVGLALDDFGTAHGSLTCLYRYPLHALRISRSLLASVPHDPTSASLVGTILHLAQRLDLITIASGVDTEAQATFLRQAGCAVMQGPALRLLR